MITDSEVRELLARAAGTIDVPPGQPVVVPSSTQRRWVVPLVAAAAVLATVLTGIFVADRDKGAPPEPAPSPSGGTIPSVFAYDEQGASQLLEDIGAKVEIRPYKGDACASNGRAVRTEPVAGQTVEPGQTVVLYVSSAIDPGFCGQPDDFAWQLLAFADGHGPAPTFADQVSVWVDGRRTVLTQQQAEDPATWAADSALGYFLRVGKQQSDTGFDPAVRPKLRLAQDNYAGDVMCGGREWPQDPVLDGRKALLMTLDVPADETTGLTPCAYLDVFSNGSPSIYNPSGPIDALVLRTSREPAEPTRGPTPTGEPKVSGRDVAQSFLDFAQGGPAPQFADQVRLYLLNEHVRTITAAQAADRASYNVVDECFPDPESNCPRSAIDMLNVMTDREIREGFDDCLGGALDLLDDAEIGPGYRTVMLRPTSDDCERPWAVQLIYDFDGRISKVNLRIPETH